MAKAQLTAVQPVESEDDAIGPTRSEQIISVLNDVGMSLIALEKLSQCCTEEDCAWFMIAAETVIKVAVRKIDICLDELGSPQLGNYADEFNSIEGAGNHD